MSGEILTGMEQPGGLFCATCLGVREVPQRRSHGTVMVPCPQCRPEESPVATRDAIDRARAERDDAMQRVEQHAHPDHYKRAWSVLLDLLYREPEITGSMFKVACIEAGVHLVEWRALGPLLVRAKNRGYMEDSGRMVPHPARHATKQTVWISKLWNRTGDRVEED